MLKLLRFFGGCLFAALLFGCAFFLYAVRRSPVFAEGESYTFYFGENSSARAYSSSNPALDKLRLPRVRGESVVYEGDCYEALKTRFRAELVKTEKVGEIVNYYLFSPLIENWILLDGETVNLHVAVGAEKTAAGTPVIFGGY